MFIKRVIQSLDKHKVRYALVGGYAVALHGVLRGTVDIDLAIGLQKAQFTAVEKALGEIGLQPRLPVRAEEVFTFRDEYIQNRNLKVWSFYNPNDPLEVVDILITEDAQKIKTVEKKVDRLRIQVASIADLIRMKTQSGRPQDIEDIKALEKLR
jgi:predicted nucleotidyltransferase